MTELRSPATGKYYRLSQICRVWRLSRSRYYSQKKRALEPSASESPRRRGPRGAGSDAELISSLRELISQSNFFGEGYRKLWARLRFKGIRTSKERVRRLMKVAGFQAPRPALRERGDRAHRGTICTARPDMMWGTDATSTLTEDNEVDSLPQH